MTARTETLALMQNLATRGIEASFDQANTTKKSEVSKAAAATHRGLTIIATLMCLILFWYGHTYSLTEQPFFIEGWIGALIPPVLGVWLVTAGWIIGKDS